MPTQKKEEKLLTLAENAVFNTRYLTEQKNIAIKNLISRKYDVYVDINMIERIITNLLTNAIKFSPLNSEIKLLSEIVPDKFIKVSVIDKGPGVSDDAKGKIFEKFTQLISKNSGSTRSTGLGLAYCKMAVEAHDGKIGIDSNEGGGATFWFTVPLSQITEEEDFKPIIIQEETIRISEANLQKLKPLIEKLKHVAIFETTEIYHIIKEIKDLRIQHINNWLKSVENATYSVNQTEFEKLLTQFDNT